MCRPASEDVIPAVAKSWLAVYHSVPKMKKDSTLSFTFAVASGLFLLTVRLISEQVLVEVFNWPKDAVPTKEAAASMASVTHSSLLCVGLWTAFRSHSYSPSEAFRAAPQWWQHFVDALLQFCTGYMLYDAAYNIMWLRFDPATLSLVFSLDDYLFLFHHIITSTYMTSTRVLQAGHMSAMMCMLLGEATNPLHNSFMISELAITLDCCNGETSQLLNLIIKVSFAAMYNLFRVIIGPVLVLHMNYDLLITKQGRTNIPLVWRILWNLMMWAVVIGSASWIEKCHLILKDFVSEHVMGSEL